MEIYIKFVYDLMLLDFYSITFGVLGKMFKQVNFD
jgi:hypothetical protein